MRIYIGFDDTDSIDSSYGTGKVARWFEQELPRGCSLWGVLRQQLLVDDRIPYTSHNSSACAVVEAPDDSAFDHLISSAAAHLVKHAVDGSDPGLCVCLGNNGSLADIIDFSMRCTREVMTGGCPSGSFGTSPLRPWRDRGRHHRFGRGGRAHRAGQVRQVYRIRTTQRAAGPR